MSLEGQKTSNKREYLHLNGQESISKHYLEYKQRFKPKGISVIEQNVILVTKKTDYPFENPIPDLVFTIDKYIELFAIAPRNSRVLVSFDLKYFVIECLKQESWEKKCPREIRGYFGKNTIFISDGFRTVLLPKSSRNKVISFLARVDELGDKKLHRTLGIQRLEKIPKRDETIRLLWIGNSQSNSILSRVPKELFSWIIALFIRADKKVQGMPFPIDDLISYKQDSRIVEQIKKYPLLDYTQMKKKFEEKNIKKYHCLPSPEKKEAPKIAQKRKKQKL